MIQGTSNKPYKYPNILKDIYIYIFRIFLKKTAKQELRKY